MPRTLYSKLTKQAENEGVSINSFVTAIIAEAIGSKQAAHAGAIERPRSWALVSFGLTP